MKINTYTRFISGSPAYSRVFKLGMIISLAFMVTMMLTRGHALSAEDTVAVFDDVEADFGDVEASFDDESGITTAVSGNQPGNASLLTSHDPSQITHREGYVPPRFFSDREPRTISGIRHAWLIPVMLIFGTAFLIVKKDKQSHKKEAPTETSDRFNTVREPALMRKVSMLLLVSSLSLFSASQSQAIVYSPVKDAVVNVLGKGQKIFQTTISMTPDVQAYLKTNLNWSPDKKVYKAYYAKAADGKPERYAFILSDKLQICGGIHTYCIAVNADGTVLDVSILELTCDRSYCINTRSFLSQFKGFDIHNHVERAKAYDAMTGATLSTDLTRDIVQRALALMTILNGQAHG